MILIKFSVVNRMLASLSCADTLKPYKTTNENIMASDTEELPLKEFIDAEIQKLTLEQEQFMNTLKTTADKFADSTEQSLASLEIHEINSALRHVKARIRDFREALKKIDDGSYGLCDGCGHDIPKKRLKARVTATHCTPCQEIEEAIERRYRKAS